MRMHRKIDERETAEWSVAHGIHKMLYAIRGMNSIEWSLQLAIVRNMAQIMYTMDADTLRILLA